MATTKITSPDLFNLESLNTALKLPSGTTAQRPTSPSTGEWRYNTTTNLVEFWDGGEWRDLQSEDIPPINSENFNVVLYNGTSATHAITGVGFKPDFVWIKDRNNSESHIWNDSTRGAGNDLSSNTNAAQANRPTGFVSFDSDGFTLGADSGGVVNDSSRGPYVAWCWKAGGGTTSSNTDGTITSTVQVNNKAGISIVEYTGNGNTSQESFGHGLSSTPELIIQKSIDTLATYGTNNWLIGGSAVGTAGSWLELNTQDAKQTDSNYWGNQLPSSTVVYISGSAERVHNESGKKFINYCFVEKAGYSKFGTYTGNGSATGPIVNTGFEPAFVMIKRTDSGDNWSITDNKRSTSNPRANALFPNGAGTELSSGYTVDYLSNGFQIKSTDNAMNANGGTYLYIAFAADASAAPVLANSFTTNLYTGNSGTQILGTGFQPSLVWIKDRSATRDHNLTDSIRGVTHPIYITTGSQLTNSTFLTSFNTDGFSLGNQAASNENLEDFVAWSWKAASVPTINTDGTDTSIVSANVAAGFSIAVLPNKAGTQNLGHGLDGVPDLIIMKQYEGGTGNWSTYNSPIGVRNFMSLNTNDSNTVASPGYEYDAVTATTITNLISGSTYSYIYYCFKSVAGFSKIGSYTGNGGAKSVTGLGFQPNFIMIKLTNGGGGWMMYDSARTVSVGDNPGTANARPYLMANTNGKENGATSYNVDLDSDGFSMDTSAGDLNANGDNYIYMAFKNNRGFASTGTMAFTVAAGGGGGGASQGTGTEFRRTGCGGGAGGFRGSGDITGGRCAPQDNINLASGTYTVTVGAGGSPRVSGSASSIAGPSLTTISTVGGGRGADDNNQPENGGSGGGRSYYSSANGYSTACEGYGRTLEGVTSWQAGGGGAGGIQDGLSAGLKSGIGVSSTMSGTNQFYAGGGAPGSGNTTRPQAAPGGGGNGQISGETAANTPAEITGTANTGGGGGGGSQNTSTGAKGDGGSGGSGIVILRLKTSEYSGTTTGSPTVTTDGDETIMQFTGSGTYVHS